MEHFRQLSLAEAVLLAQQGNYSALAAMRAAAMSVMVVVSSVQ